MLAPEYADPLGILRKYVAPALRAVGNNTLPKNGFVFYFLFMPHLASHK